MSNTNGKKIFLYIFVEGNLDEKFWRDLKKSESIQVIKIVNPSCHNNSNEKLQHREHSTSYIKTNKKAIECIFCKDHRHLLNKQYSFETDLLIKNQAIGMVDMDFEHSYSLHQSDYDPDINIQYDSDQFYPLFRTETRDLEILLSKNEGLLNFLSGHFDEKRSKNIIEELTRQSSISGYARFFKNEYNEKYVSFKSLNFFIDGSTPFRLFLNEKKSINCKNIANYLQNNDKNKKFEEFFKNYCKHCPNRLKKFRDDLWTLCQGHDTMAILRIMLENYCGWEKSHYTLDKKLSNKLSERILDQFIINKGYKKSSMIECIINWEKNNHPSNFDSDHRGKLFIDSVYDEFNK
ncbi:MAG: hypothetical protein WC295_00830 [Methanoregula sp.]|jgi:hypothetical protein